MGISITFDYILVPNFRCVAPLAAEKYDSELSVATSLADTVDKLKMAIGQISIE